MSALQGCIKRAKCCQLGRFNGHDGGPFQASADKTPSSSLFTAFQSQLGSAVSREEQRAARDKGTKAASLRAGEKKKQNKTKQQADKEHCRV